MHLPSCVTGRSTFWAAWLLAALVAAAPVCGQETEGGLFDEEVDADDPGQVSYNVIEALQGKTVVRIEEDFIIDIAVTDSHNTAPEIVTVFGTSDPTVGLHAVFEMNHSTYPTFVDGGMQIQGWHGGYFLRARRHPNFAALATTVERITYTCRTRLNYGRLEMEVINGQSVTWGAFGGDGRLRIRLASSRPFSVSATSPYGEWAI